MEMEFVHGIQIREYETRFGVYIRPVGGLEMFRFVVPFRIFAADVGDVLFPLSGEYHFADISIDENEGIGDFMVNHPRVWESVEVTITNDYSQRLKRPLSKQGRPNIHNRIVDGLEFRINMVSQFDIVEDGYSRIEKDIDRVFPEMFGSFQKVGSSDGSASMLYGKEGVDLKILVSLDVDDNFRLSSHFDFVGNPKVFGDITLCMKGTFTPDDGVRGFPVFHLTKKHEDAHTLFLFHPMDGWKKKKNSMLFEDLPLSSILHHEVSFGDDVDVVVKEELSLSKMYQEYMNERE